VITQGRDRFIIKVKPSRGITRLWPLQFFFQTQCTILVIPFDNVLTLWSRTAYAKTEAPLPLDVAQRSLA
jgi:hypothetical protein